MTNRAVEINPVGGSNFEEKRNELHSIGRGEQSFTRCSKILHESGFFRTTHFPLQTPFDSYLITGQILIRIKKWFFEFLTTGKSPTRPFLPRESGFCRKVYLVPDALSPYP